LVHLRLHLKCSDITILALFVQDLD
jgi:hypothetical protein